MIKISIIIPVYNSEKYLSECLDSIIYQGFDDFEIICIDDCSTDSSYTILKSYLKKYNFINVIKNSSNKGASFSRNKGIEVAKGKYIWFIDSDDVITENSLATMYECAEKNDADIVCFGDLFRNDDELVARYTDSVNYLDGIHTGMETFRYQIFNNNLKVEPWHNFVKRELLTENHISFYEGIIVEDMLYYYYIYSRAQRVYSCDLKLYEYRQHADSVCHSMKHKISICVLVVITEIYNDLIKSHYSKSDESLVLEYIYRLYRQYKSCLPFSDVSSVNVDNRISMFFTMINSEPSDRYSIHIEDMNKLKSAPNIVVYGAGAAATDILELMKRLGIYVRLIIVSNKAGNPSVMYNIPVCTVSEMPHDLKNSNTLVVIGTDSRYHSDIINKLNRLGFTNYVCAYNLK